MKPNSELRQRIVRHWPLYAIIALPTAFLLVFSYWPMVGVQIAFRNFNPVQGIWGSPWVGLQQFELFLSSPYFWPLVKNTLVLSLYYLIVSIPCSLILALALNEVKHVRFKKTVQMFTYAPYFISTVILVGMIQIMLSPTSGPLALFSSLLGNNNPPNVLASADSFSSVYVWSGIWQETGYAAIIYLAALASVNPELYEAARIDGASRLQKIRYIDLPGISSTIIILMILSVGGLLSIGFEKVFLLQNNLNLSSSEVISTYVYKIGLVNADFSFATAISLFNSVIGLILITAVNYSARKVSDSSLF
ncbi:binding-protein-dependent transport systems inner membrane component [Paenibacillus sp. FSL R7-277]|uniref:ABC transporter permease n=1 Tax=unclassified Paenibacillus TaxID=185978 RepID=UPI0003E229DA|nr:ABC transporter permease subunit [Paenibacillus sp. FSL R7-277]ETT65466.1 binding-protein-dependent transport systems inner membrane component [Paenibacillus sp. FSL R7-277]